MSEVLIKVCGLTEVDNALDCAAAGADWIGLNFYPASPRSISIERGAEIVFALRDHAEPVGLFVNHPIAEIREIVNQLGLRTIQLHGDESPEFIQELNRILPIPTRIIRAFRLADGTAVERMIADLDRAEELGCPPYAILVDAHVPGLSGGTGQAIPTAILDRLPAHPRLILAGGLDPTNVAERISLVRPWMVDVASGVESSPGVKDLGRVSAFIKAARANSGNIA